MEVCNQFDICNDRFYTDTLKKPEAIIRYKMTSMYSALSEKYLKHEEHHKKQIDDKDRNQSQKRGLTIARKSSNKMRDSSVTILFVRKSVNWRNHTGI